MTENPSYLYVPPTKQTRTSLTHHTREPTPSRPPLRESQRIELTDSGNGHRLDLHSGNPHTTTRRTNIYGHPLDLHSGDHFETTGNHVHHLTLFEARITQIIPNISNYHTIHASQIFRVGCLLGVPNDMIYNVCFTYSYVRQGHVPCTWDEY